MLYRNLQISRAEAGQFKGGIDSYFLGFNGFLFEDLLAGKSNPEQLSAFAEYRGQRRIIQLNTYPMVWIPKSAKRIKCEGLFQ